MISEINKDIYYEKAENGAGVHFDFMGFRLLTGSKCEWDEETKELISDTTSYMILHFREFDEEATKYYDITAEEAFSLLSGYNRYTDNTDELRTQLLLEDILKSIEL